MKTIKDYYKKHTVIKLLLTFLVALIVGYATGKLVGKQIKKSNSIEVTQSN